MNHILNQTSVLCCFGGMQTWFLMISIAHMGVECSYLNLLTQNHLLFNVIWLIEKHIGQLQDTRHVGSSVKTCTDRAPVLLLVVHGKKKKMKTSAEPWLRHWLDHFVAGGDTRAFVLAPVGHGSFILTTPWSSPSSPSSPGYKWFTTRYEVFYWCIFALEWAKQCQANVHHL